jgi:DNA-binding XRE family transcriptional regulator
VKNYKKVELYLSEQTINQLEKVTTIENQKNSLWKQDRNSYRQLSDFIKGLVIDYFDQIENESQISGYDDLGKPFRLMNRFKEIANKKGISQKQMAEMTNIDPSNISYIWRNRNQPSLDYFLRIWIALDYPPLNKCLYRDEGEDEK